MKNIQLKDFISEEKEIITYLNKLSDNEFNKILKEKINEETINEFNAINEDIFYADFYNENVVKINKDNHKLLIEKLSMFNTNFLNIDNGLKKLDKDKLYVITETYIKKLSNYTFIDYFNYEIVKSLNYYLHNDGHNKDDFINILKKYTNKDFKLVILNDEIENIYLDKGLSTSKDFILHIINDLSFNHIFYLMFMKSYNFTSIPFNNMAFPIFDKVLDTYNNDEKLDLVIRVSNMVDEYINEKSLILKNISNLNIQEQKEMFLEKYKPLIEKKHLCEINVFNNKNNKEKSIMKI